MTGHGTAAKKYVTEFSWFYSLEKWVSHTKIMTSQPHLRASATQNTDKDKRPAQQSQEAGLSQYVISCSFHLNNKHCVKTTSCEFMWGYMHDYFLDYRSDFRCLPGNPTHSQSKTSNTAALKHPFHPDAQGVQCAILFLL